MNNFFKKLKQTYGKYAEVITPTAVLAIICVVVTLALSSTNLLTEGKISELSTKAQNEAMSKLIEADEYPAATETLGENEVTYNAAIKGDEIIGYIFTVNSKGYGGDVSVMTAVNTDGSVAAVEILDASGETPGLGQNVTKSDFYDQYKNLKDKITVVKNSANQENGEINAVTGATISSKAVTQSVNQALEYAAQIIAKGATE